MMHLLPAANTHSKLSNSRIMSKVDSPMMFGVHIHKYKKVDFFTMARIEESKIMIKNY